MMVKVGTLVVATALLGGTAAAELPKLPDIGKTIRVTIDKVKDALEKLRKVAPTKEQVAGIKDDDKKEAECKAIAEAIDRERKQYQFYKDEIDKKCKVNALKEWFADYRKIQETFGKALDGLQKALKAVQDKLSGANAEAKNLCKEELTDDCLAQLDKVIAKEEKLQKQAENLKKAVAAWKEARDKRVAAEKADFYKDMERCHDLDLWGERVARNVANLIKANKTKLTKCNADLAEIKHENLEFRKQTIAKIIGQSAKCRKLNDEVKKGLADARKRNEAIAKKKCMTDGQVATWVKSVNAGLEKREQAILKMPRDTVEQQKAFSEAGKRFLAYKNWVASWAKKIQENADKCQAELAAMRAADAFLDKLLSEKAGDLRECNVALHELREQLARANREIAD